MRFKISLSRARAVLVKYLSPARVFVRWLFPPSRYRVRDPMDLLPYMEKGKWMSESELRKAVSDKTKWRWYPSREEMERAIQRLSQQNLIGLKWRSSGNEQEMMKL